MRRSIWLVLLAALACSKEADEPVPALAPLKTRPIAGLPDAPEAKPDVAAANPAEDERPLPFRLSADAKAMIQLHPLLSGELYMSVGPKLVRLAVDGRHRPDPNMLRGLVSFREPGPDAFDEVTAWQPVAVGGRHPDGLYLALRAQTGFERERDVPDLYQWDDPHQRWAPVNNRAIGYAWTPTQLRPWVENSILCDRAFRPYYPGQQDWDGPSDGPTRRDEKLSKKAIEGAKPLIVIRGPPKAPAFDDEVTSPIVAFDSVDSGEILAALADGSVMWWRPAQAGEGAITIEPLPAAEGNRIEPVGVRLVSAGRGLIYGGERSGSTVRPYLATVDDGEWNREETFDCGQPIVAWAQAEAQRWAVCGAPRTAEQPAGGQALWTSPPRQPWKAVPLPDGIGAPRDVVARRRNDVWIVTQPGPGSDTNLLHNGPIEAVVHYPSVAELADELLQWGDPLSATQECTNVFTTLDDEDVDFEAIGKAITGRYPEAGRFTQLSLVRTTFRGKTTAGLQLWAVESIEERTRILHKLKSLVGSAALGTPYCYYSDGTTLQKWSLGPPQPQ